MYSFRLKLDNRSDCPTYSPSIISYPQLLISQLSPSLLRPIVSLSHCQSLLLSLSPLNTEARRPFLSFSRSLLFSIFASQNRLARFPLPISILRSEKTCSSPISHRLFLLLLLLPIPASPPFLTTMNREVMSLGLLPGGSLVFQMVMCQRSLNGCLNTRQVHLQPLS